MTSKAMEEARRIVEQWYNEAAAKVGVDLRIDATCLRPSHLRLADLFADALAAKDAEIERLKDDPDCMTAEHGGHPTCVHIEQVIADLRERAERAEADLARCREILHRPLSDVYMLSRAVQAVREILAATEPKA